MKKLLLLSLLLTASTLLFSQENLSALMPMPNRITEGKGKALTLDERSGITADKGLTFAATTLQQILSKRMNLQMAVNKSKSTSTIHLQIDPSLSGKESYKLNVTSTGVTISGSTAEGILHGVMTFDQLLLGDSYLSARHQITPVRIEDTPRLERRVLMLDPARHFLPLKDVKLYVDQMMKYKFNVLQMHLTDDQGWRVEIKGREKLTETGPFYTQDELKELVVYAQERGIEVVPELDIPGHTVAFLHAYPELGCTSNDTIEKVLGKTFDMMVCAAVPEVYTVYQDILTQVCTIFPSPYIHLGGDEAAISKNWATCERCQALMKEKGYTDASQLMIPFFEKMLQYVRNAGKTPILWCEPDKFALDANYLFPYPKDVQLVSWRAGLTPTCISLTKKSGNKLLLAPGEYAYLDYPQLKGDLPEFNNWGMPITTLRDSYKFDPGYGKPLADQNQIIGIMGTLWGEAMLDINRVFYMTFPRAFALSEAGWTELSNRSWSSFKKRVYPNLTDLTEQGIAVRAPFEIANEE